MELRQFIAELKGRGVYRMTAIYSAGAWVLLQVADVVVPAVGLPESSITALLVLAAIGFPIALVLAWLFDLTPEGVVDATPVTAPGEKVSWSRTHIVEFALIILLALLVGYLYLDRLAYQSSEQERVAQPVAERASIAVMPFVNMSDVADMEYLGDGLAEEILNLLAQLDELNVAARTSSFYFKNREVDIQMIGEHLGVAHVLEGSVRYQGDRIRVTAQLIKAEDGFHVWSETYDREPKDLLALQDDIARQVVNSLHVLLSPDSREALSRVTAVDPLAYDYYLRGRAYLRLPRDEANLKFAVELFRKAVAQHAAFADAYAGLCDGLLGLYSIGLDVTHFEAAESACHRALTLDRRAASVYIALGNLYRSSGQYDQAIGEFNTALSLNRTLPDAHLGLGDTYMQKSEPETAEQHYRRAIELQPNYWQALMSMGNFLFQVGRVEEAIPYYRRISELMPESETAFNNMGAAYFVTGDFERASSAWQRSLDLAPSSTAYSNVASSEFFLEHYDRAISLYHKAVELAPEDYELWGNLADAYRHSDYGLEMSEPMYRNAIRLAENRLRINASDADTLALAGHYCASIGEREKAVKFISDAAALAPGNMYVDYNAATAWAALGERERALQAVERAVASGYPRHIAAADANLETLRESDRFRALTGAQR